MKAIWKWPLSSKDSQEINIPRGAEILCVQMQNDYPTIWAKVDAEAEMVSREIIIIGTGHPHEEINHPYIGTVQQYGGSLVWHIFDAGEVE